MRSWGNALRPKARSLAATSATSSVLPSRLTVRRSRYHAPRVRGVATGPTTSSCKRCTGSYPSRDRASEMPASPAMWILLPPQGHPLETLQQAPQHFPC